MTSPVVPFGQRVACFSVPETLNLWWCERSQVRSLGTKVHAGLRWSWENSQTRVGSNDTVRVWVQKASGAQGWDQQHVSPEGGSSSWLPLCAEHLHGTIKKAAEGLWPRHEIHLGIQTLPGLHHIHFWVCCHFSTIQPTQIYFLQEDLTLFVCMVIVFPDFPFTIKNSNHFICW